jgi:predicted transcriptional regulator
MIPPQKVLTSSAMPVILQVMAANKRKPRRTKPSPLALRRLSLGLSQDEVAQATEIDRGDLSRHERGLRALTPARASRLDAFYAAVESGATEPSASAKAAVA